jgi:hypothetical protein
MVNDHGSGNRSEEKKNNHTGKLKGLYEKSST